MRVSPAFFSLAIVVLGCGGGSSAASEAASDGGGIDVALEDASLDEAGASDSGDHLDASTTDTGSSSEASPTDAPGTDASTSIDPSAPGPNDVTVSATKVGTNNAHLLVPKGTAPDAGFPAVVFAHGFQLAVDNYDDVLKHVASHGFVVLSVDFPGSLFSIDHRDVRDAIVSGRAALIAGSVTGAPKVNAAQIASMGHSLGGKGAVWAAITDAAFAATVALDPVDGNPSSGGMPSEKAPVLAPTETAKLTHPVGYFGATQSHCTKLGQACAPDGLDAAHFFAGTSTTKYLWTVFDFGHMQFLDNPSCGFTCSACAAGTSPVDPRKTAVKAVTVAFLRRHVLGDATMQPWLDGSELGKLTAAKSLWDGKIAKPACP